MIKEDIKHFIRSAKEQKSKTLDLSNKDITEIPEEIGEIISLKKLILSYNSITHIPDSICNLKNLEELYLLRNNLSKLPSGFNQLKKLKVVDVSYNPIVKLPHKIGECVELEFLDASYCDLRALPIELTNLIGLKTLSLEENSISFPPEKVVKRGLYAIMHFLTIEKKKKEASKVMMQVFNLPSKVQGPFREYINYFNHMISKTGQHELMFDLNFINQDFYQEMELNTDVETYLFDVMRYIQQKIEHVKLQHSDNEIKEIYIESRVSELKEQLIKFNSSLDDKINEIKSMKKDLSSLSNLLDE